MLELKQLEYFVVCADCKSFSRAAEVLYTTQPNVSRVIRQLESHLGVRLFIRQGRGITLSEDGKQIYQYAANILNNTKLLASVINRREERQLALASLPSNLIANLLVCWYNAHKDEDIFYAYWEGPIEDVVKYVESHQAEIGLVAIHERHMPAFQYLLAQKKLVFVEMTQTCLAVSGCENSCIYEALPEELLHQLKLISYQGDNFALDAEYAHRYRVLTNSENALIHLLRHTDLVSVGAALRAGHLEGSFREQPLFDGKICVRYGYIKRKANELSPEAADFIQTLQADIDANKQV